MEAKRDFGDCGRIIIRVSDSEASLIAEGLYAVEKTDRHFVDCDGCEIDERDREGLMGEIPVLAAMRASIDAALRDKGLTVI